MYGVKTDAVTGHQQVFKMKIVDDPDERVSLDQATVIGRYKRGNWKTLKHDFVKNHFNMFHSMAFCLRAILVAHRRFVSVFDLNQYCWTQTLEFDEPVRCILRSKEHDGDRNMFVLLESGQVLLIGYEPSEEEIVWKMIPGLDLIKIEGTIDKISSYFRDLSTHIILSTMKGGGKQLYCLED